MSCLGRANIIILYLKIHNKYSVVLLNLTDPLETLEEARFQKSTRGVVLLNDAGYKYYFNKSRQAKSYWKCSRRLKLKCPARAVTNGFYIKIWTGQHNHPPPDK